MQGPENNFDGGRYYELADNGKSDLCEAFDCICKNASCNECNLLKNYVKENNKGGKIMDKIKIGDIVRIVDGSWALILGRGNQIRSSYGENWGEAYEVMAINQKLPISRNMSGHEQYYIPFNKAKIGDIVPGYAEPFNDTVLWDNENHEIIFIMERHLEKVNSNCCRTWNHWQENNYVKKNYSSDWYVKMKKDYFFYLKHCPECGSKLDKNGCTYRKERIK